MDSQAIQAHMAQLSASLNAHNHAYYVLNRPLISDYEFDILLKELETLESQHPSFTDPNSPTKRGGQPAIDTAFGNIVQTNITHMNHAKMDMAVASFFHESNIPFNVVGSSSFKLMLSYARLVGKDYKPPNRNAL